MITKNGRNDDSTVFSDPSERKKRLATIPDKPNESHRALLLALFRAEMQFRDDLWHGRVSDDDDHFENIYECAFLICQLGRVEDVFLLWNAKHLNMDVGASLGVEYFLGAGLETTLKFLDDSKHEDAPAIRRYLMHAEDVDAQAAWEQEQLRYWGRRAE